MNRAMSTTRILMLAAVAVCTASCAGVPVDVAGHAERHGVEVIRDIRYASDGPLDLSPKHLLDIYRPADMAPSVGPGGTGSPVLIFIHGGAWRFGDKVLHPNVGQAFAARGIVMVSVNYGLAPFTRHPGQIRDVAKAFAWVRKHIAEYGGDPDDIFVSGHSAGGHLAALLALNGKYLKEQGCSPDDIRGVIGMSGLYRVGGTGVFSGIFANDEATIRDASPAMHVGDRQPPFLLFYGDHDLATLDTQAVEFNDELQNHRSPVKLVRVPNRTHEMEVFMIGAAGDPVTADIMAFIRAHSGHNQ